MVSDACGPVASGEACVGGADAPAQAAGWPGRVSRWGDVLALIIHDAHGVVISPVSHSPIGCGHARCPSGAGVGSMVRIVGFEIAVEGLDRGDTAPWFK